jgi:hypothetical protein
MYCLSFGYFVLLTIGFFIVTAALGFGKTINNMTQFLLFTYFVAGFFMTCDNYTLAPKGFGF